MSNLEILAADFKQKVASNKMRTILHTFQIVSNPEPYVALLTPEDIEGDYYYLPEFDVFRHKLEMPQRTSLLKQYLGDIASLFTCHEGEPLRNELVTFGDEVIHEQFDRPLLVSPTGTPLSANHILPDPELIAHTVRAARGYKPATYLNIYFEHAIAALGDRTPQI